NDPIFSQLNALRGNMALLDQDSEKDEGQKRLTMDALRSQAMVLEAKIAQAYPRLSSAGFLEKLSDFESGFSMLAENETALEYFVEGEWLHCFVLNSRGIVSWEKTAFPEEVRPFLAFFKNPNAIANAPDPYKSLAYTLAQLLLPPQARSAQKLCIIPDGLLCFVPFEALLTSDCPACNLRNAPYLIRTTEVHYAFSLSTLARQKEIRPNSRRGLLAYAPIFQQGERGLAPLTSGKEEWQSFGFINRTERIGGQASAASFLTDASKYSILHLSTHVSAGEQPRIEFYDRSFFLPEVYALPLNAELVVLSACETGLGVEQKGEGVMSLARAFAQAGAPGIISSLWSVNDKSTSTLFNIFYSQLRKGIPASASLRNAKLQYLDNPEIRSSLQTPYYWAGFVAVGDDRSIAVFSWYWALFPLLGAILVWVWMRKRKKEL
ncbi:MAG: CHAT domain-containing protein, partial [Saprospiraceae bacterium]|nr:CHAT domain-containing protein [Saprospiraceae bacterium]